MMPCNIAKRVLVMAFLTKRVYGILQVEEVTKQEAMARGQGLQSMSSVKLKGHRVDYQATLLPLMEQHSCMI